MEGRQPAFITAEGSDIRITPYGAQKYLWGNVPALDLLNLKQNGGVEFAGNFRLLLAGTDFSTRLYQLLTQP